MGVRIDDARRDDQALGVEDLRRGATLQMTQAGDLAVPDADVDATAGESGPVDHQPAGDDQVELGLTHAPLPRSRAA